jgi:(p)ppGpp synthase/HD superfamily hydrolase
MEELVNKAKEFSYNKHNVPQECKRYGNAPYTVHIESVVEFVNKYKYYLKECDISDVLCAAYLHDTIEDTPVTPKIIRNTFNDRIAKIVSAVTNERGDDRKEMNFKTYPRIWTDDLAIFVKLCDRLSNTNNSKNSGHKMYIVYQEEYPVFRYALKVRELYPDMWAELDELNSYEPCKF